MPTQVVLGVCGGIAAYKAAEIVRGLIRQGADVTVVMTRHARRFITPLTLQTLSGRRVITSAFKASEVADPADVEHIGLSRDCGLLLVAPATADVLGKMAAGIADDFLTTFSLAVTCPVLVAPAMNTRMWEHPAVQANVARLVERGVQVIGPDAGPLASRAEGEGIGRLADPQAIVERAIALARATPVAGTATDAGPLSGRAVLVTAGPTREPMDPVRFVSSPSTGKMGFAVARAARDLGARVVLVTGPTHLPDPVGVSTIRVVTAEQMRQAVMSHLAEADVVVKTAAVSDFRPARPAGQKIKKGGAARTLELEPTADILAEVTAAGPGRLIVGFAAETDDLVRHARAKLEQKGLDLIVANDVGGAHSAFGSDAGEVVVLDRNGLEERWPRMSKEAIAARLLDLVARRLPPPGRPR